MKAAAALLVIALASPGDPSPTPPDTGAGADDDSFWVQGQEKSPSNFPVGPEPESSPPGPAIVATGGDGCASTPGVTGVVGGGSTTCTVTVTEPEEPEEPAVVTIGMVRRAFARLPLPASTLVIQPPDGLTLVNFDTNFFTTSTQPITRNVRLLGQPITIEATPSEYHWHFDDTHHPEPLTTTEPGAAYPDLTITHNYTRKGTYQPRLDTTYTGRYRIGTSPWQTIPGTVTITGRPQQLQAIEAQPKLVGY